MILLAQVKDAKELESLDLSNGICKHAQSNM